MRLLLGSVKSQNPAARSDGVWWDDRLAINGHMLIAGASGTGKTHRIRSIVSALQSQNPDLRVHVLDQHGDIKIQGESRVVFSETSPYGLNPLRVSPDRDFGGVRKRVRAFVAALKRTSAALGAKQEACIINLLSDLYGSNGFFADDPRTWSLAYDARANKRYPRRHPTILDLKRFADYKLRGMLTGSGSKAMAVLDRLNKKTSALERAGRRADAGEEVELAGLRSECVELYQSYVESIETGRELDDAIRYSSKDVLASVCERITTLESSGIFKNQPPPFDEASRVWAYDVRSLSRDEAILFADTFLEDLFMAEKAKGESKAVRTLVVIDEAHLLVSEEPGHVLTRLFLEARKLGVACLLASQGFAHFPQDILTNAGMKCVLGISEEIQAATARALCVEPRRLGDIIPRKTALVQVKNAGELSNRYLDVVLP